MSDAEPIYLYGNDDRQRGVLQGVTRHVYAFEVNGAHTLSVSTTTRVSKEDRLVTMGEDGRWQEFVVVDPEDDDSSAVVRLTCERSEEELAGAYIESRRPTGDPARMLAYAFEYADPVPRWEIGDVEVTGPEKTQVWYHTNAREVMTRLQSTWGGEFEFEVVVEGAAIVRRVVHWRRRIGAARGKRFSYGKNLAGISRSRGTNRIYTRVYGYGAGLAIYDESGDETGGYSRRITFGDVNGGRDYVESDEARLRWGRPDGKGGRVHVVGKVEFDDEQDRSELLRRTREWAEAQYEPQVTYTAKVADFERAGRWGGPTCEGDDVTVDDDMMDPPLLATDRVVSGSVDRLCPENTTYTIGKVPAVLSNTLEQQYRFQKEMGDQANDLGNRTTDLTNRSKDWDFTTDIVDTAPGEWLRKVMDRINQEMNEAKTYKFTSIDKGDIWANGPLTADGKPEKGTTAAIALNGLGFRISSEVRNGDFVWTTFGTGAGFTANVINVGTLRCGDNYLNLDTGEMRIALTAKVGGGGDSLSGYVSGAASSAATSAANAAKNQAIQQAVSQADQNTQDYLEDYVAIGSFDGYLTMRNVFNALTHNGVDKGFFIDSNRVFVNADYVRTGVLESQNGMSVWDLNNGYFETGSTGWSGGQFHGIHTRIAGGQYAVKMDNTDIGTMSTYSSGNVHPFGIKVFTDLVLAAPSNVGVSYSSTTTGGLTYTKTMRDADMSLVAGVSKSGTSLTFDYWHAKFMHGMLTSLTNTADSTFSTASMNDLVLVASVDPVSELDVGGAIAVEDVATEAQLMEAASEGRMVLALDPDTGRYDLPVYTGEEWTDGVPTQVTSEPVEVPTTEYVEAQTEAIQSEIEAMAGAIGDAIGTTRAKALRASLANVRRAMASGETAALRTAARTVAAGTEAM